MLREELARRADRARHHRRRHILGEIEHQDFFRRVADRRRVVDDQSLVLDPLEQMGRRDVAEVERRVLAHQHDIDVAAEVEDGEIAALEMIARDRLHGNPMRTRVKAAVLIGQIFGEIVIELVAALLGARA